MSKFSDLQRKNEAPNTPPGGASGARRLDPVLSEDGAMVFQTTWDEVAARPDLDVGVLSDDERTRAARFVRQRDRERFRLGRAWLRLILSSFCGKPPEALRFGYGRHGKPSLASSDLPSPVSFNAAHSGNVMVVAVISGRLIGVDVERQRSLRDADGLARRYFAPGEWRALAALPEAERHAAFFRIWTRKEAYLKALGSGLAKPLDSFEVSWSDEPRPRLLRVHVAPSETARWTFRSWSPQPGYEACLCLEHRATGC